jgi:transglutaminase-like putative cysteine protease
LKNTNAYEDDYEYYEDRKPRKPRRRVGEIVSTVVILAIIIILILLVANPGFREAISNSFNPDMGGYREYPEWADYTVERLITVSPEDSRFPMDYEVDLPTPEDIPNATDPWLQDVKGVDKSPAPDDTEIKFGNYEWMVYEGVDVSSTRQFRITYEIHTESAVWSVDPSESGTVDDIPQWLLDRYGNQTTEEWVIIPADPQVKALSDQLTAGKLTVYSKYKAIFDYLNENYEYQTTRRGEPKFCYDTLASQRGDCDDQSVLFISLARAAGLPSWLEFGALYNQKEKTWGGHAWIRAYIPYYYGGGHVFNIDVVNDHFLFRDAYRFSEWESDGNGSHLKDYYYSYGSNFDYEETYTTLRMEASSDTIRISENGRPVEETVPGFEAFIALPAIALIAILMKRKRK